MEYQFDPDNPKYEFISEPGKVQVVLDKISKEKILALDVETTGLDPYTDKLLLFQIGPADVSYIFDCRKVDLRQYPLLKEILEGLILKLMQNGKFDYKFIKHHLGISVDNIFDTFLAEEVLNAGLGKRGGLGTLAKRHLDLDIDKALQSSFIGQMGRITEAQLKYAGIDTLILFPIFEKQFALLKKHDIVNVAKLEFAVTRVVAEMELAGIFIDQTRWKEIINDLRIRRDKTAKEFQESIRSYFNVTQTDLFGNDADVININSNLQLMDLFNNKLGLNMPSTGTAILGSVDHPVVKLLQDYRGDEKLISSFGDSILDSVSPITNRIHPDFKQMGAATGRFACANPNLQQIPSVYKAPFRECFNPQEGYDYVVADYSSFEMRILADLSGDTNFVRAMNEGLDMHSFTASLMFDLPYEDIKDKYKEKRQAAKALGFGLMYGMGAGGLANRLGISTEEGQDYMNKYFGAYPSVKSFLDGMANNAVKNGWSSTPAGRKRWYNRPDKSDPDYRRKMANIERQAKNHPIQGTNADAIKFALVYLHERLAKEGVDGKVILTVHDEVVCEVREDQSEAWSKIQEEEMVRAGELFIKKVPVKSDPFVGKMWEH